MYTEFDLHLPRDLEGALEILAGNENVVPLAGGTNLIVDLRARAAAPAALVGLGEIPDLRGIRISDGRVVMGGKTTLSDLLRDTELATHAPSLVASARVFGGQMVRNTATVAGNVCYGSPAADLVPPLLVLDTEVTLESQSGDRSLPLAEFFLDFKHMARRPDELLTQLSFPVPAPASSNLFYKLARRKGDAIAVVGIAVALGCVDGTCRDARIALGAVAPVVKRAIAAELMLEGERLTPDLVEEASRRAAEESSPIDDLRASAEYRRHCVHMLTRRLLTQAWNRVTGGDR